jgi:hypothetical protein
MAERTGDVLGQVFEKIRLSSGYSTGLQRDRDL